MAVKQTEDLSQHPRASLRLLCIAKSAKVLCFLRKDIECRGWTSQVSERIDISSKSLSKTGSTRESPGPDPAEKTNEKFTDPTLLFVSQPRGPQDQSRLDVTKPRVAWILKTEHGTEIFSWITVMRSYEGHHTLIMIWGKGRVQRKNLENLKCHELLREDCINQRFRDIVK